MYHQQQRFYVLLILLLAGLVSCKEEIATEPRKVTAEDLSIERIKEVEILYSDSAILRLSITAPVLLNHLESGKERKEFADGLKADFFNEYGNITSTLTALYAVQYERDNKIYIRDSVVVKSANNETLETEELIWDEQQKKLYTDKWVKVSTANEVIYGYGFSANQEFTYWNINKVRGRLNIENLDF